MFLAQLVACLLNGSIDAFFLIKIYSYIGFVYLCNWANNRLFECGLKVYTFLFKWLSIFGILSILLFPLGLLKADRVYTAVFFLGGKNASLPFYFLFLFSWYLKTMYSSKKLPEYWFIPPIFMVVASLICKSVNSLLIVSLVFIIAVLYIRIKPKVRSEVVIGGVSTILACIYIGLNIPAISRFLELFGRNTTFSYRTFLWSLAFKYFKSSPIYGCGYPLTYTRGSLFTDHAHSWYLDTLAKYGLMGFIPFMLLIIIVIRRINSFQDKYFASFICLLLAAYLLHMGFDDYNLNFFVLILMIIDGISSKEKSNKQNRNKIF